MPNIFTDSVALVTGAGRGIGRAVALRLAGAGCNVVLAARTDRQLRAVSAEIREAGGRALAVPTDITVDAELKELVRHTSEKAGDVSILVNCAGAAPPRTPHHKLPVTDLDRTLATCLRAPMVLTRLLLGPMMARRQGVIVNVASQAWRTTSAGEAAYSAAKAGLLTFSRCLFNEVRDHNVKVVTISPGYVDTDFIPPNRRSDRSRFLRAEDVGVAVVQAIATSAGACCTEVVLEPQLTQRS
jgi:NAD(P)-dependent dehydrogenase (short-subunit alcohol dehydrogenase family)